MRGGGGNTGDNEGFVNGGGGGKRVTKAEPFVDNGLSIDPVVRGGGGGRERGDEDLITVELSFEPFDFDNDPADVRESDEFIVDTAADDENEEDDEEDIDDLCVVVEEEDIANFDGDGGGSSFFLLLPLLLPFLLLLLFVLSVLLSVLFLPLPEPNILLLLLSLPLVDNVSVVKDVSEGGGEVGSVRGDRDNCLIRINDPPWANTRDKSFSISPVSRKRRGDLCILFKS